MKKEVREKIVVAVIFIVIAFLVMWYGAASGLGASQCFAGVAC